MLSTDTVKRQYKVLSSDSNFYFRNSTNFQVFITHTTHLSTINSLTEAISLTHST